MNEVLIDKCKHCGLYLGYGLPEFHLEICDDCRDKQTQMEDK